MQYLYLQASESNTDDFIDKEQAFSNPIVIPTGMVENSVSAVTPFSSPVDGYCLANHLHNVTFKGGSPDSTKVNSSSTAAATAADVDG